MLSKPAIAIGKHASVPGKYWNGCPAADKEKRFMCIVVEFTVMHDFGDGVKGAGFKMKEMGENGNGSLEPGVASGSEFIMAYPLPFLEHYFFQNRSELPDAVREKAFPAEAVIAAGADGGGAADEHLVQLCRGCLAALTELEQVAGENLLVRRLVGRSSSLRQWMSRRRDGAGPSCRCRPRGCRRRGSRQETKKKTFLRVARGT